MGPRILVSGVRLCHHTGEESRLACQPPSSLRIGATMTIIIDDASARATSEIGDFVEEAFTTARVADGHERDLVVQVRTGARYVPQLELAAVDGDQLVGYALASATSVTDGERRWEALYLGPICTRADRRDDGIGSLMLRELLSRARTLGYGSMFLAGDTAYYPRFGFKPASTWGVRCQYDIPSELLDNIMGIEIVPGALDGVSGVVTF